MCPSKCEGLSVFPVVLLRPTVGLGLKQLTVHAVLPVLPTSLKVPCSHGSQPPPTSQQTSDCDGLKLPSTMNFHFCSLSHSRTSHPKTIGQSTEFCATFCPMVSISSSLVPQLSVILEHSRRNNCLKLSKL